MHVRPQGVQGPPVLGASCGLGPASVAETHVALLDTGAEWSVVAPSVAKAAGAVALGERIKFSTRHGLIHGDLARIRVALHATLGLPLVVDGTVFVPDHGWPLQAPSVVLGFRGMLETVRFAIDARPSTALWWFAS